MVIVIRGACSVGKSSTARSLARLLPMSAHVDCDDMLPWMSDATLDALQNHGRERFADLVNDWLAQTANILDQRGLHAVIDRHFPTGSDLDDLLSRFDEHCLSSRVFNLLCAPPEHLARDQQRSKDAQVGQKGIDHLRLNGSWVGSPHGIDIDTTTLSPDSVARAVLQHI